MLHVFGFFTFWIVSVVGEFIDSTVGVEVFIVSGVVDSTFFSATIAGDRYFVSFSVLSDCCEIGVSSIMVDLDRGS